MPKKIPTAKGPMTYPAGPYPIAKSGISVDAGNVRIRVEATGPIEERQALAKLLAAAPEMVKVLKSALCHEYATGEEDNRPTWVEKAEAILAQAGIEIPHA